MTKKVTPEEEKIPVNKYMDDTKKSLTTNENKTWKELEPMLLTGFIFPEYYWSYHYELKSKNEFECISFYDTSRKWYDQHGTYETNISSTNNDMLNIRSDLKYMNYFVNDKQIAQCRLTYSEDGTTFDSELLPGNSTDIPIPEVFKKQGTWKVITYPNSAKINISKDGNSYDLYFKGCYLK